MWNASHHPIPAIYWRRASVARVEVEGNEMGGKPNGIGHFHLSKVDPYAPFANGIWTIEEARRIQSQIASVGRRGRPLGDLPLRLTRDPGRFDAMGRAFRFLAPKYIGSFGLPTRMHLCDLQRRAADDTSSAHPPAQLDDDQLSAPSCPLPLRHVQWFALLLPLVALARQQQPPFSSRQGPPSSWRLPHSRSTLE